MDMEPAAARGMGPSMSMSPSSSTMMNMNSFFYWGNGVTILFEGWKTNSTGSYGASLLALLVVSFLYQYLERLTSSCSPLLLSASRSGPPPAASSSSKDRDPAPPGRHRHPVPPLAVKLLLTLLFAVRVSIGYFLMLAVMTYNGGIFIAVVLGLAAGFLLFRTDIHSPPKVADSHTLRAASPDPRAHDPNP